MTVVCPRLAVEGEGERERKRERRGGEGERGREREGKREEGRGRVWEKENECDEREISLAVRGNPKFFPSRSFLSSETLL